MKKVINFNRLPKQEYIKPAITELKLQYRSQFLAGSPQGITSAKSTGLDGDIEYDKNGDAPGNAW